METQTTENKPKYSGYGYHGGGRKPTGKKYKTFSFSCTPEEYEKIKSAVSASGMKQSEYILSKLL